MTKASDGARRPSPAQRNGQSQQTYVANASERPCGSDSQTAHGVDASASPVAQSEAAASAQRHTVFVTALSGWSDACYAVSDLVQHVASQYSYTLVKRLCSCKYYDFQQNRPMITTIDGERRLMWPESSIVAVDVSPTLRLLVLSGSEPNLYWEDYANTCLDIALAHGVERIVSLSSMLDDCPHTRELPMSHWGSVARGDGTLYVPGNGDLDEYRGPVSMNVVLNLTAADACIPIDAYTVSVPRYMASEECPQATLDLLNALSKNLGEDLETADLGFQSRRWHARADAMTSINPDLRHEVERLEREHDTSTRIDMEMKLSRQPDVCEQLVQETEKFLLDVQLKGVNIKSKGGLFDAHAVAQIHTRFSPHAPSVQWNADATMKPSAQGVDRHDAVSSGMRAGRSSGSDGVNPDCASPAVKNGTEGNASNDGAGSGNARNGAGADGGIDNGSADSGIPDSGQRTGNAGKATDFPATD